MSTSILIVDDASFIREILRTIAQVQGWKILGEALDGAEAIDKALKLKPDVIIMDIVMPKFNGIQAARQILEKLPEVAIIGLSTLDSPEVLSQAIEVGFVSFIQKPFNHWTIINAVKEAIQTKEIQCG